MKHTPLRQRTLHQTKGSAQGKQAGQARDGGMLAYPPAGETDLALFRQGWQLAAWQAELHRRAQKKLPFLFTGPLDWLLVDLLVRRYQERSDTGLPDFQDALRKLHRQAGPKEKLPAPATLRKIFKRLEEARLLRLKRKVGRTALYEPTPPLLRELGALAQSLPPFPPGKAEKD